MKLYDVKKKGFLNKEETSLMLKDLFKFNNEYFDF